MLKISMLEKLRFRVRDLVARIFRRERPEPARFAIGSDFSGRGWLAAHPWIWPSRDYLLYVPRGYGGWRGRPLIVLIHGFKQTPEGLSAGPAIAARAAPD